MNKTNNNAANTQQSTHTKTDNFIKAILQTAHCLAKNYEEMTKGMTKK